MERSRDPQTGANLTKTPPNILNCNRVKCRYTISGVLHGSAANTSGRRRTGLALRYLPSTAWFRRDASVENSKLDWTLLPLQLVRSVNRNELNDLRVGHGDFDPLTTSATF